MFDSTIFTPYQWGKSMIKIEHDFFFYRHFPSLIVKKSKKMRGRLNIIPYHSVSFLQSLTNTEAFTTPLLRTANLDCIYTQSHPEKQKIWARFQISLLILREFRDIN